MPFIRGRYHINPVAGEALEAARDAEDATAAHDSRDGNWDEDEPGAKGQDKGRIHHVEIESAELVPGNAGRGVRGFLVRVKRHSFPAGPVAHGSNAGPVAAAPAQAVHSAPETHAFTDHRDLLNFLHGEFAKECSH